MIAAFLVLVTGAAALLGLLTARSPFLARTLAVGSSLAVLIAASRALVAAPGPTILEWPVPGFTLGQVSVPMHLGTSGATAAVAFVVALVAAAVQVYSTWYLRDDDRYPAFAATVSVFTSAMLLVVHSRDLILTLVGWEVMGWCSYLLIGHWSRKESARRAALKSFLVTRVADIGFVLAVAGLAVTSGSTSITAVIDTWGAPTVCDETGLCTGPDATMRNVLLVLFVLGVLGKAAQLPFQDWLPDAMEGPTPASALIHAATMVAAGTVVLASVFPVLAQAGVARWLLGLSTAVTMLLAAVLAMGQSDLKRLLAWSTVSQVGIMLSALAAGPVDAGPDAGLFHLWSHAVFKSLLFLAIGLLGVIAGGTSALLLRGAGRRSRLGRWTFLAGLLSLIGVPFLVGGLSKEHVIAEVYAGAAAGGPGLVVLAALLPTVVVTAAYSTRAYLVISEPIDVTRPAPAVAAMAESGRRARARSLTPAGRRGADAVLVVLAVLSLVGGLVLVLDVFDLHGMSWAWTVITVLLIAIGCALVILLGRDGDPGMRLVGRRGAVVDAGLGADRAYLWLVARPVVALARLVTFLDTEVIDGYVRASAVAARVGGRAGAAAHRPERVRTATWLVITGLVLVLAVGVLAWR